MFIFTSFQTMSYKWALCCFAIALALRVSRESIKMIMSKKHKKMVTIIISLMLIIFLSYRVLNPRVGPYSFESYCMVWNMFRRCF